MPAWQSMAGTLAALTVASFVAVMGSAGGLLINGISALGLACVVAFAIQWLAFIPAFLRQTEHFFDLTGSLTYISLALFGVFISGAPRSFLLGLLVLIWAARLGTFLFSRVREDGSDRRFNSIKPDFAQFLMTWTLQGLWVFLTLSPALAAMTSQVQPPLGALAVLGTVLWIAGFVIEVVADRQKRRFRSNPENRHRYIDTGLWAWSQHPNYFGEILLWTGIAVIALPVLQGTQLVTLVSPIFVYLLLTKISGIRMLDARARRQWGEDPAYQAYRRRTSKLLPLPPKTA